MYVIQFRRGIEEKVGHRSEKGYLYVGGTGKSVEQRFEDNYRREDGSIVPVNEARTIEEDGGWHYNRPSAKLIRRYYRRHRPNIEYFELNPITRGGGALGEKGGDMRKKGGDVR